MVDLTQRFEAVTWLTVAWGRAPAVAIAITVAVAAPAAVAAAAVPVAAAAAVPAAVPAAIAATIALARTGWTATAPACVQMHPSDSNHQHNVHFDQSGGQIRPAHRWKGAYSGMSDYTTSAQIVSGRSVPGGCARPSAALANG